MKLFSREITAIALPAIVSNITTPLLAMVDLAIVGHIGSAEYIAAIALGASMFNMLYWLFGFLRMGSSGLTAQAFGRKDTAEQGLILYRALSIGLIGGLLLIAVSRPVCDVMLRFMDADAATLPLARSYFLIAVLGAPATLSTFALTGWFLGMQNSRVPMVVAIATNIVNIVMSLVMVFYFKMELKGVAIGSASAQWVGFLMSLFLALRKYKPNRPKFSQLMAMSSLRKFFSVNADIFLRTLCLVAVTVWFTRAGSTLGVDILAANAVLLQLFMFFSYFMDGFAFAAEALSGKYEGRGDSVSLKATVRRLVNISILLAVVFSLIYLVGGNEIVGLLTDDKAVRVTCGRYILWAAGVPLTGTLAFVYDGILIGLTRTRIMLTAMAVATAVFFIMYFLTRSELGNHGLWLSFVIYLALRGLVEMIALRHR